MVHLTKKVKIVLYNTLVISAVYFCGSFNALAVTCSPESGDMIINYGNIIVQRDTPIGGDISRQINGSNVEAYYCTGSNDGTLIGVKSTLSYSGISSGSARVYRTNLPGVGIALGGIGSVSLGGDSGSCYITEGCYGYSGTDWQGLAGVTSNASSWSTTMNLTPYFKLVKIGTVTPGQLTGKIGTSVAAARAYNSGPNGTWFAEIPIKFGSGTVTVVACSITTPNLVFPIGDVAVSKFGTSVGTLPSGAQNTQNLGLDCDPQANINVTLTGTRNPDVGTLSVLALTGQGNNDVAKGVGVQIVYNGTPLSLNQRLVLKRSPGGMETFPLTARYYQTKTTVAAGTANSSATLNLTYQ